MTVSTTGSFSNDRSAEASRRLAIGFLNWAHALDHFVILIYPTVVIELAVVYGRSYATLIALSTASYMLGPLFSLRLLEKFGRSPLRLSDGLAAAFLIAATVPLPYIVFTRLVPAVTGLSLSPAGFGISLFVLIMCALISLYGSVGLTRRSSQPLADE